MTKDDLQKELKEKVKEGIKPSHLKRSKSLNDLPKPEPEILYNAVEENRIEELKQKITRLEDQIIELRLSKLKEFGEYLEQKKELKAELESNINYGVKEIERLENKLKSINKKKLELQDQLSQTQSKNARLELKLIEEQNKDTPLAPNSTNTYGQKTKETIYNKPKNYYQDRPTFHRGLFWIGQNNPSIDKRSFDNLIQDLKRQVQHYQNLYQRRVSEDVDKLNNREEKGTQTDLSDQQINLLTQQ
ncbi:26288_t:CDS:2 [Gigaspora margarita]|uniref:26288_t:CDS:1 n=1 Tax=Gigaspora margarita TaxID=4874 RepID=A0ABN7X0J8_GIGMA|nr:26288_t:CDS:2 [Gigaspora margarita]